MKTRVPDKLDDEQSMRAFFDATDRRLLRASQINDLAASPTTTELATAFNELLAALRTK